MANWHLSKRAGLKLRAVPGYLDYWFGHCLLTHHVRSAPGTLPGSLEFPPGCHKIRPQEAECLPAALEQYEPPHYLKKFSTVGSLDLSPGLACACGSGTVSLKRPEFQ